ncbi:MAG: MBL fold metallo-hydrolase [Bacteroidota bacterium]|jgi:glyoxylase-like metal-dependent hydrolase (beta-lactamase superfamily II)
MIKIHSFVFGPFQENTYLLYDETKECVILDPGNNNAEEDKQLYDFISNNNLLLKRLILTHGHIDHINGNKFIFDTYGLLPEVHQNDLYFIENHLASATMYGLIVESSPIPKSYINEGDTIVFGNSKLNTVFTPGHSPGSISFYNLEEKFIIVGDVLFRGSIGRTDLPLGNFEDLMSSIETKLFPLGDDLKVYNGHGQPTTIGFERLNNPFLS